MLSPFFSSLVTGSFLQAARNSSCLVSARHVAAAPGRAADPGELDADWDVQLDGELLQLAETLSRACQVSEPWGGGHGNLKTNR